MFAVFFPSNSFLTLLLDKTDELWHVTSPVLAPFPGPDGRGLRVNLRNFFFSKRWEV